MEGLGSKLVNTFRRNIELLDLYIVGCAYLCPYGYLFKRIRRGVDVRDQI